MTPPFWLMVAVSSIVPGSYEQSVSSYKVFSTSQALVSYMIENMPIERPKIFQVQEYGIRSEFKIHLEKK